MSEAVDTKLINLHNIILRICRDKYSIPEMMAERITKEVDDYINYHPQPLDEEGLREKIAKWLFEKKAVMPNPRFYPTWIYEVEASPLTHEEYLKLAAQILSLLKGKVG
jgi:hypothetical protein